MSECSRGLCMGAGLWTVGQGGEAAPWGMSSLGCVLGPRRSYPRPPVQGAGSLPRFRPCACRDPLTSPVRVPSQAGRSFQTRTCSWSTRGQPGVARAAQGGPPEGLPSGAARAPPCEQEWDRQGRATVQN